MFLGEAGTGKEFFASRLVTQMYFPGDPLLAQWSFDQTSGIALAESTGRGVAGALKGTAFAALVSALLYGVLRSRHRRRAMQQ